MTIALEIQNKENCVVHILNSRKFLSSHFYNKKIKYNQSCMML